MNPKLAAVIAEMQENRRVHEQVSTSLQQSLKKFNSGVDNLKLEIKKAAYSFDAICHQSSRDPGTENVIILHRRAS